MKEMSARYDPSDIEEKIYESWLDENLFHADGNAVRTPYSIMIPPPNITGVLHMGHALNNTIQDILIRWKRMQGNETLWMPGTDHAGIATQNVVERELAAENLKRSDLGREKFIDRCRDWKEEYGSTIIRQLKRMGFSCDWERERFTMDKGLSNAVRNVFVKLYEDGLIYKGNYIINWCPRCGTALSDEEAEHRDVEGLLYYIKYPVAGRKTLEKLNEDYVIVATTRPETMLGDVAVAANPKDPKYKELSGKNLILPILKRELKLIFDEDVDPEFGTGALKVTPAHDPVDFELGKKHGLESINVMHPDGRINSNGGDYEDMDRFECREAIIEDLKQRKLFVKAEKHLHAVGHCYRCHTVVEPRLSKQWFVKMKPLAEEAIDVVKKGQIKFYPQRWTKVYLNWMENIRDWCISRQIWWGHRIPVWYCKKCLKYADARDVNVGAPGEKGVYVGMDDPVKCPTCGGKELEQDPDVLDTWFSSWLWPFSTLGWPEKSKELDIFYPTNALVTAQEIIFFWVARMIMAGLKFQGDIPFRDVYIHGTVRDSTGTKMSKSLGNVIDPLDVIKEVGSDALRFSIISITSQGQDVFLSKDKFDIGRNFTNKIWNASRYVMMKADKDAAYGYEKIKEKDLTMADRWILTSFNKTVEEVTKNLNAYRFNDATSELYDFIWHKYCDWYLEMSKLSEDSSTTQQILIYVLSGCMRLLHPFMPFITEEIWQKMPGRQCKWIMTAEWPVIHEQFTYSGAIEDMEKLIGVTTSVRNARAFWNIGHKTKLDVLLRVNSNAEKTLFEENSAYMEKLSNCTVSSVGEDIKRPDESVASLVGSVNVFIPLSGAVDVERERGRINEKIEGLKRHLNGIDKKLTNNSFLAKAPDDIVNKEKEKKQMFEDQIKNLEDNLCALK